MAGAFNHHLHVILPGDFRQFAQRMQLGELRLVVGVLDRAGAQTIAEGQRHVIGGADFTDFAEVLVEEVFLMMRQAPLGHDGTTARHDTCQALRGHRHVAQQYAGVNREVVDALFGLFQQGIAEGFPGQVLGNAVDLLQRLVNRDGTNRHRAVAQDPLAGLVDIAASGEVHHRVGAPAG